jgi:hypothetical protein
MSRPLRLGDRVTVTSTPNGNYLGTRGRLVAVDVQADILEPYHVVTERGGIVWASSVRRSRIQFPEAPYRLFAVVGATFVVAVAALVGYGRHETQTEPMQPTPWVVEYGPAELIAPYLPPEERAGHTDRDGERVPYLGEG